MKNTEIRKLAIDKITTLLKNTKIQYLRIKYNHKIEVDSNPIIIRYTRRFIARLISILHEKQNKL